MKKLLMAMLALVIDGWVHVSVHRNRHRPRNLSPSLRNFLPDEPPSRSSTSPPGAGRVMRNLIGSNR